MSAELPWRYRIVPACWEWARFDAGWTGGGVRGLRALVTWHRGRCAVCGARVENALEVDSDPETRWVRGLLCGSCFGGESRSDAKVFRSYRRLHPTVLLGLTIPAQVLGTGFWRRWKPELLRTSGGDPARPGELHVDDEQPGVLGRPRLLRRFGWGWRSGRRLVVDPERPDRVRAALARDSPDPEQVDRLRLALHQALEDVERYAGTHRAGSGDADES